MVDRYELSEDTDHGIRMVNDDRGDYVLYYDYEELEMKYKILKSKITDIYLEM